ncbi:MAG TPA: DUF1295 domain-containing protein [Gaiellaceae bacterium]|nr:DUF1295 domain-containing protein [Gaiellaceae bacterium]
MIDHRWQLGLIGWAAAASLLGLLYLRQRRTHDATAVDAGWAVSLAGLAVLYAVLAPGAVGQRALIATVAAIESMRIAFLILGRVGDGEDRRYRDLRSRWREAGQEQTRFAIFYQAQALLAVGFSVPFLLVCFNGDSHVAVVEWVGVALWIVAFSLEAIADHQLARFRSEKTNKGEVLRSGLWRYSRHPNYFFQTLIWLSYALISLAAPWGWLAFFATALMLYLIRFVTGVPPTEASSLRSRGDDYRRYQRETPIFVPWLPRSTD